MIYYFFKGILILLWKVLASIPVLFLFWPIFSLVISILDLGGISNEQKRKLLDYEYGLMDKILFIRR